MVKFGKKIARKSIEILGLKLVDTKLAQPKLFQMVCTWSLRIFRASANFFSLRQQYIFTVTSLGKYIMYKTKHVASFTLTFIMTGTVKKQQLKSYQFVFPRDDQIVCCIFSCPSAHDRNGLGWCPSHRLETRLYSEEEDEIKKIIRHTGIKLFPGAG